MMDEDELHEQAFGEHTGISPEAQDNIDGMTNRYVIVKILRLSRYDCDRFTDLAWRLLGKYIANNSHLVIQ